MGELSHFDESGASRMVDVTGKEVSLRTARASGRVRLLASNDASWTAFAEAPQLEKDIAKLEEVTRHIQALHSVPLPVMTEQAG